MRPSSWRNYILVFTVLAVVLIQTSFLAAWRPLGVVPNLFLLLVALLPLVRSASQSLAAALGGGLLLDLTSGSDFGLRLGFYTVLVLLVLVLFQSGADADGWGLPLVVVVLGTVAFNLAVLAPLAWAGVGLDWLFVGRMVMFETMLNLGLLVPLRPAVTRLLREPSGLPQVGGG